MDDLQHRLLVSQWIAEEFAGIIDEDRRAKLEAWRKESAGNEQEYQELLQEFRSGDILEPYPEEEIGRQWKKFSKRNRTIHPVFRYEGTAGNIEVTPCSLVCGFDRVIIGSCGSVEVAVG